ncbi:MAG: hypothetical protein ACRC1K_10910 [Planctomycetia bacterium]
MAAWIDVGGIGSYFESLEDPRDSRNRKHLLVDVVVAGMIRHGDGPTAIHRHPPPSTAIHRHPPLGRRPRRFAQAVLRAAERHSLARLPPPNLIDT